MFGLSKIIMSNKFLVSIVIPTKDSAYFLENCLKSIKKQSYKNIEIIVIDNNSRDDTKEIARKYTKLVFNKGPERSAQRNFGALKSKGKYLFFVDSDMELSKKVVEECVQMSKINKIGGVVIPELSFGKGFWARCKTLERSFYVGVDWIEAARFFKRNVFEEFNGFDVSLISGEDWDLSQKVKSKYDIGNIKSYIFHNEGNLSLIHLLNKKKYYGSKIKLYSSKKNNSRIFSKQSSIIERYKLFFSRPKKLFADPILGFGMLFMKTCEFGVGAFGYLKHT